MPGDGHWATSDAVAPVLVPLMPGDGHWATLDAVAPVLVPLMPGDGHWATLDAVAPVLVPLMPGDGHWATLDAVAPVLGLVCGRIDAGRINRTQTRRFGAESRPGEHWNAYPVPL
jgi:hypothetical protein